MDLATLFPFILVAVGVLLLLSLRGGRDPSYVWVWFAPLFGMSEEAKRKFRRAWVIFMGVVCIGMGVSWLVFAA